jgi:hypothetical protein
VREVVLPGSRLAKIVMIAVIIVIVLGLVLSTVAYPLAYG